MATTDPTDEALLRRIAEKDEGALAALYDRYAAVSLAVAMKVVGDRAEAEDVLQNVYVRVWQDAGRFDPARGSVAAWLLSSIRNAAIDRTRRRDAYLRATKAAPIRIADEPEPIELREDQKRVVAALQQLPADQREAIELAYFKGLSQTEIAQKLGQPLGTVKTRMRLGMMKLREALR
jgi:RNA polymerase sigma-70 factor (ECF subfamily)